MRKKSFHKNHFGKRLERGGISIFFVLIIVAIGILFFSQKGFKFSQTNNITSDTCILPAPDIKRHVMLNGVQYNLIRASTYIIDQEAAAHLHPTSPQTVIDIDGKTRASFTVDFEIASTEEGVENLLFVAGDDQASMPGFHFYGVFLKAGVQIPPYIQSFCNDPRKFPVGRKLIQATDPDHHFPPLHINTKDITDWENGLLTDTPSNRDAGSLRPQVPEDMYIISYEPRGSPPFNLFLKDLWPTAKLAVTQDSETKVYDVHYLSYSILHEIALVDNDPASPDYQYAYRYVAQKYLDDRIIAPTATQKQELQLYTFGLTGIPTWGWWMPECKPAIYLYPQTTTDVSVKVRPDGYLTYTNPQYPENGWHVVASPDGTIASGGKTYPYLYYESKIRDEAIQKPTTGYLIPYQDLASRYQTLLPELGLRPQEVRDFITYWQGKLPYAPYYFVGIMTDTAIHAIEPLSISPKPDTTIRVRLYFEARDALTLVTPPSLTYIKRNGFTVVEWGGLVKADKSHPFTCSQ